MLNIYKLATADFEQFETDVQEMIWECLKVGFPIYALENDRKVIALLTKEGMGDDPTIIHEFSDQALSNLVGFATRLDCVYQVKGNLMIGRYSINVSLGTRNGKRFAIWDRQERRAISWHSSPTAARAAIKILKERDSECGL